jgi:hypothetical protein
MKNKLLAYGGAAAGVGLIVTAVTMRRKPQTSTEIPQYVQHLTALVGEDTMRMISTDPAWTELAERASEFYVLAPEEFKELLRAIAHVVAFQMSLQVNRKMTFGTPRLFRTKLHAVVEAVRTMRAVVADKCVSAIDDFDEVAADIQRAHDDAAYNVQLEAGC